MKCELAHERIVATVWEELPDDLLQELEDHLRACAQCKDEKEQVQELRAMADTCPALEPDANLVARSRMRLDEALDALPPRGRMARIKQRIRNGFATLTASPVAASLLLLAGAGAGALGGYQIAASNTHPATLVAQAQQSEAFVRQPDSHLVEVRDTPSFVQNAPHHTAQEHSTATAECHSGNNCRSNSLRDTLLLSLRYDKSVRMRQKALKSLEPYVAEDQQVRNAVLDALLNDSDVRIRNAAIQLLQPVDADTSVRQVLHTVADTDVNPYIRTVSRQVLSQVPEIQ